MAIPPLAFEIIVKLIIVAVVTVINMVLIREIVSLFGSDDDSLGTAAALAIWVGGILFLFSFLNKIPFPKLIPYVAWILPVVSFFFMIYLVHRYYSMDWKDSVLVFESWTTIFIYIIIIIYAFTIPKLMLLAWGLIPLALNAALILLMRTNTNKIISNAVTSLIGFVVINYGWYLIFKIYFPI